MQVAKLRMAVAWPAEVGRNVRLPPDETCST